MDRTVRSPEFDLLVACCRASFDPAARIGPNDVSMETDRQCLLGLARRHRVQGLAWQGLQYLGSAVPEELAIQFAAEAQAVTIDGLRQARESRRLLQGLTEGEIGVLFVKGLALGALVYDNPFLKMAVDIDLLVSERDIGRSAVLLGRLGYELVSPRELRTLADWHRLRKESVWRHPDSQIQVDLHSRLSDSRVLIGKISAASPRQLAPVAPGVMLPTLADDETFAYLCVHGAASAWFRLKWLTDLAAFLHRRDVSEIGRLLRRAEELGAGRTAAQAILLSNRLFQTRLPTGLAESLRASRVNRLLERMALKQLLARRTPTERPFGTSAIHVSQLFLCPGLSFKFGELARIVRTAYANRRFA